MKTSVLACKISPGISGRTAYGNGRFVVVAGSVSLTSTDTINWTSIPLESETEFSTITFGSGRFVAGGLKHRYATGGGIGLDFPIGILSVSPDGTHWNRAAYSGDSIVSSASSLALVMMEG